MPITALDSQAVIAGTRSNNRDQAGPWFRRYGATARNLFMALPGWARYRLHSPKTIVILGMHRSGTSCITRMIHLCGAAVGEIISGNQWNQEGHWEAREGLEINEYILRLSGGSWDQPPARLRTDARVRWRMRGFLGRLHRQGTAVWKDPRTVLTFPLWKPMLRDYLLVAAFRHPVSVARSLKRRDDLELSSGLDLWRRYNQQLLAIAEQEKEVLWIDFDCPLGNVLRSIEVLCQRARLQYDAQIADSYEAELRTCDALEQLHDHRVAELYQKLRSMTTAF